MSTPFLVLTTTLILSSAAATNDNILIATQEMQKANHFAFVMLINMVPPNTFGGNITFLMPNDRALASTNIGGTSVLDFLLCHSIPSPLLVDDLHHFPTGSMIPASKPGFMFKVTNHGRGRRFFLSNVRIISPNICTEGTSIRCHGIDGVVQPVMVPQLNIPTTCTTTVPPPAPTLAAAPSPSVVQVSRHKSSSCCSTVVDLLIVCLMLVLAL